MRGCTCPFHRRGLQIGQLANRAAGACGSLDDSGRRQQWEQGVRSQDCGALGHQAKHGCMMKAGRVVMTGFYLVRDPYLGPGERRWGVNAGFLGWGVGWRESCGGGGADRVVGLGAEAPGDPHIPARRLGKFTKDGRPPSHPLTMCGLPRAGLEMQSLGPGPTLLRQDLHF